MWKKLDTKDGFHFNGKGGNSWKRVTAPFLYHNWKILAKCPGTLVGIGNKKFFKKVLTLPRNYVIIYT